MEDPNPNVGFSVGLLEGRLDGLNVIGDALMGLPVIGCVEGVRDGNLLGFWVGSCVDGGIGEGVTGILAVGASVMGANVIGASVIGASDDGALREGGAGVNSPVGSPTGDTLI